MFGGQQSGDIGRMEEMEEVPDLRPICINDKAFFQVRGNTHQAMWMLTRQQILLLEEKCAFLDQSDVSRERMSSFFLFNDCRLTKLIPGPHYLLYTVHHFFPSRHPAWVPTFASDENLLAGYRMKDRGGEIAMPDCWSDIVRAAREEQTLDPSPVPFT